MLKSYGLQYYTMDDQEFRRHADQALDELQQKLLAASGKFGFDSDFSAGALLIEFEDPPVKFVVSPNAPVQQIWVSANLKSHKLSWDSARNAFVLPENGASLSEVVGAAVSQQIGEKVSL